MKGNNFCTLFDSNYLSRALALYRSLEKTGEDFALYAVCFDESAYQLLKQFNLPGMVAISLQEFESPQLQEVKRQRTAGEYCWTCTPHVIRYVLDTYHLSEVTYLDADLYFYANPNILLREFKESGASVLITPHRYTPRYDQSATSGIYCVQFMTFKANEHGLTVLQWWQDRCIEWCFNRFEDGKFGDQKYLDNWPKKFSGVHILQHIGGGVAPWNIQQYTLKKSGNRLYVNQNLVVFYHYHAYKQYKNGVHDLGGYKLTSSAVDLFYRPYIKSLHEAKMEILKVDPSFSRGFATKAWSWRTPLHNFRRRLSGEFNEYRCL